jgi:hypothetical protein
MTKGLHLETREFTKALREFSVKSSRALPEIINARMFYVLARAFLFLRPANPEAERARIRNYLREPIGDVNKKITKGKRKGKKVGKNSLLRRVHLITQAKARKGGETGLYGKDMRKASGSVMRRAIGSVGYLAAPVAKAIKRAQGHFPQFGGTAGSIGGVRPYRGNAALEKLADEYGIENRSNIALHKGARASVQKAFPGFNPTARADMTLAIADDQVARVEARYLSAFSRAFADERREMERHVAHQMQQIANQHNARKV